MDVAQRGAAEAYRRGYIKQAAARKHDVRCVNCDVGASADRYADIRPCERGRVIYPVADHGGAAL